VAAGAVVGVADSGTTAGGAQEGATFAVTRGTAANGAGILVVASEVDRASEVRGVQPEVTKRSHGMGLQHAGASCVPDLDEDDDEEEEAEDLGSGRAGEGGSVSFGGSDHLKGSGRSGGVLLGGLRRNSLRLLKGRGLLGGDLLKGKRFGGGRELLKGRSCVVTVAAAVAVTVVGVVGISHVWVISREHFSFFSLKNKKLQLTWIFYSSRALITQLLVIN
jgi:hypothetical protein